MAPKPTTGRFVGLYASLSEAEKVKRRRSARQWREKNREHFRRKEKARGFLRRYGITLDDFNVMLASQDNACAICRTPHDPDAPGRRGKLGLHVDHDHRTGKVRGLLCNGCNRALGFVQDRPEVLRAAADYLAGYAECASMVAERQGL